MIDRISWSQIIQMNFVDPPFFQSEYSFIENEHVMRNIITILLTCKKYTETEIKNVETIKIRLAQIRRRHKVSNWWKTD